MNDNIINDIIDSDIKIVLQCTDGDINVPLSIASTSMYIINIIKSIGYKTYFEHPTPIPVKLSRKHIHYYTIDRCHHHLPKNFKDIIRYNRTLQGTYQSIRDQIMMCRALIKLDSVDKFRWIERIIVNDYYYKKDISKIDIETYMLIRGRTSMLLDDFKLTLREFKQNEKNLRNYIRAEIRHYNIPIVSKAQTTLNRKHSRKTF